VLYTLIAVKHFLKHGEAVPWWNFTAEGKDLLKSSKNKARNKERGKFNCQTTCLSADSWRSFRRAS